MMAAFASIGVMARSSPNYLFRRKDFGLSPYWPRNAEWLPGFVITLPDLRERGGFCQPCAGLYEQTGDAASIP